MIPGTHSGSGLTDALHVETISYHTICTRSTETQKHLILTPLFAFSPTRFIYTDVVETLRA